MFYYSIGHYHLTRDMLVKQTIKLLSVVSLYMIDEIALFYIHRKQLQHLTKTQVWQRKLKFTHLPEMIMKRLSTMQLLYLSRKILL